MQSYSPKLCLIEIVLLGFQRRGRSLNLFAWLQNMASHNMASLIHNTKMTVTNTKYTNTKAYTQPGIEHITKPPCQGQFNHTTHRGNCPFSTNDDTYTYTNTNTHTHIQIHKYKYRNISQRGSLIHSPQSPQPNPTYIQIHNYNCTKTNKFI